ncbi:MAG: D-alanyl-D-alanine carboxypeptidase/D-alanyl-D-alanine-endopeptidase [Nevskiaceae bacterium]|jgi:D-alanyl-D-alanine carboxypeptidase/D-alanyl-D-alanine-endopeptidase (penicillin-binding protein 4)|nr:D-alanyl-D-alanine carboxypeptidase/D-alanyl-D-alanine-endopeptidase [Nevskiaceae bacterium]
MELRQRLLLSALLLMPVLPASTQQAQEAVPIAAQPASPPQTLPQLRALQAAGAAITVLAVDLDTGRTLAELQPRDALTPASLSKLFVAAAALQTFAPDHTFRTQLLAAASPNGEAIEGDLVLRGSGDATLDEQALWSLGAQLRELGVRRIGGRLLVERAPFGKLACDNDDRCDGQRQSNHAYDSMPSGIGVNYGNWCVTIRPTRAGQPATLRSCGAIPLPIAVQGRVLTGPGTPRVDRFTEGGVDRLSVGGSIAMDSQEQMQRSMSDPALGTGLLLRSLLAQLGITVTGGVETRDESDASLMELASIEGLSVDEAVDRMMRYSNNYIADVMTMNVALAQLGPGARTLAQASQVLSKDVPGAPLLNSGSGLTTDSRVSAYSLVELLAAQYRDTRHFPLFYGALVVPHDAPFSYLRTGAEDWQDRVALKTGSLSEPLPVYGLAGYLRKRDRGLIAFAMLVNGTSKLPGLTRDRSLRAMREDLTALLRQY